MSARKFLLISAALLLAAPAQAQLITGGGGSSSGSGDVTGPGSAVADDFASFSGTTGKIIKDSNKSAASFAPAGAVVLVSGSNPTIAAADWAAFTQYTITGSGRTLTIPASSGLSINGGLQIDTNASTVTVTANAADTITWNGATTGSGGSVTLPQGGLYAASTDGAGKLYVSTQNILTHANIWAAQQSNSITTLSISTATFTPDGTNNNYKLTLVHASCPCTLANPSATPVAGTAGVIEVIQSATGSDTIGTWGSQYIASGGTSTITLSTGANAQDFLSYFVIDSTHILITPAALNASH